MRPLVRLLAGVGHAAMPQEGKTGVTGVIYEPKGRAREYAPLALNLYRGCGHGCTYCYSPAALRMPREEFYGDPQPRADMIARLEKDAKKLRGDLRPVLLCFTCDPYQPINDEYGLARQAIKILNGNGIPVHVLTKRGSAACKDFDLLAQHPGNAYAVTLTRYSRVNSVEWEPYADSPQQRIYSLRDAYKVGIRTWVSFEPVLSPRAVFDLIDETHTYVDLYKVGKWNYDKRAKGTDWPAFRERVIDKLEALGKQYLIKRDLLEA